MTTTISNSNIVDNIWKNFYDRISTDVTSVTLNNSSTVTVQLCTNSFPDNPITQKSNFPIIIIDVPKPDEENFTFGKNHLNGTVDVTVYGTGSEVVDKLCSKIFYSIAQYGDSLRTVGLFNVLPSVQDTDYTMYGKIKVHWRVIRFKFQFYHTK